MGLANGIASITQFIVFPFTNSIMLKLGGPIICMELGTLMYCLLLLAISFIKNPWIVLPVQILQGTGAALFMAAYIKRTMDISPKEVYYTMFSINISLFFGASGTVASLLGSVVYQRFKGQILYQGTCVLDAVYS